MHSGSIVTTVRRPITIGALVFVGYLALAVLVFWHVWASGHPSAVVACPCGDPSNEIWDFGWMPYALGHGLNPFLTNRLLYPSGANLVDNAAFFLPAFVLSPVTVLFGPVMTYGVAGTLGPALSAWCAYLMVRRFTLGYLPAVLAGLFYGFSPFVVDNLPFGHANIVWFFFPPLLVIVLHELIVRQDKSPIRGGVLLGLVMAGQFYTGAEMMVLCTLVGAIAIAYLVITNPRQIGSRWRHALAGGAIGGVICFVLIGYPVVLGLAGPQHYSAVPWTFTQYGVSPIHLASLSTPAQRTLVLARPGGGLNFVNPDTNYLGPALLALLAVGVIRWRRDRVLRFSIVLFAVCTVLAIGIPIEPSGHAVPWTPWRLFVNLPILRQVTALHFVGMGTLFVALALGIVLEHLRLASTTWLTAADRCLGRGRPLGSSGGVAITGLAIAGIGAGVLVPIALSMSLPLAMQREVPPRWFTQKVAALPSPATLLVLPYPSSAFSDAMVWQADAGFSFRQVGGFQLVPGQDGQVDHSPPGAAGAILADLSAGTPSADLWESPTTLPLPTLPLPTRSNLHLVRALIQSHRVTTVVATGVEDAPPYAVGFMTAALGEPPRYIDGSWVWSRVGEDRRPPLDTAVTALSRCVRGTRSPSVVADCMMTSPPRT